MTEARLALPSSLFQLPAFADSPKLRLLMGALLYLAQGFPQGIFFAAIPTWLAANGQSTAVVASAVAAASLPWSLKFLAGLFMDRYTWRPMGRRRPWLIGSQAGIVATLVMAAALSPSASDTAVVIGMIFALSVLTAVQDVALDALVVDLTPEGEMGRMNGFMFGGKVLGIAGGSAITSYLLQYYGFSFSMLGMIGFFALPALSIVLVRERKGEKLLPWTSGAVAEDAKTVIPENWFAILVAAFRNLFRRQTLLVAILLLTYGVHQNLNDTTGSLFAIRQMGWSQSQFTSMLALSNIVMGLFCLTVGGWIVDRFGPGPIAFWSGAAALPIMMGYLVDEALWQSDSLYIAWYFTKNVPLFLFYLANLVLAMRVATPEVAATSLSVLFSITTIGFVIASAILPTLENIGGFQAMFGASAVLVFVAGLISLLLSKEVRQAAKTDPSAN
ncbi:Major Facilitator Superfamily protein [Parasphingorhabdus marina DSM 22363]|uniref:Major Facilitator Superfamily protein n=1 Tax=Parasphingorhabdus marina DSM 22363 TaxID=1123272 RepID=A0A1N6D312_9SPHN|nr:MFS transporter [Parasphingorhabdus marina]SIN65181.1 Major Facilitator Superfamily protein [Parasphingorhabdus marina DSM 22363]